MSGQGPKRPPEDRKIAASKPKPKPVQVASVKPKDRKG